MRPWASIRRDWVTRLISSRMWVISLGGTTASWGYGPGGIEMSPMSVSLSRNTSLTMFPHARSASVPISRRAATAEGARDEHRRSGPIGPCLREDSIRVPSILSLTLKARELDSRDRRIAYALAVRYGQRREHERVLAYAQRLPIT